MRSRTYSVPTLAACAIIAATITAAATRPGTAHYAERSTLEPAGAVVAEPAVAVTDCDWCIPLNPAEDAAGQPVGPYAAAAHSTAQAAALAELEAGTRTAEVVRFYELLAWVKGLTDQRLAAEAEAAAQADSGSVNSPAGQPRVPLASGGGTCFGGPVPDSITQRESGGDPTIVHGGGHAASPLEVGGAAWGCYQTLGTHWQPGHVCGDITDYSTAGQKECASRLPASAWNL